MSLRRLPVIENLSREDEGDVFPGREEVDAWRARNLRLKAEPAGTVVDILEPIGKNPWTGEGVDTKGVKDKIKAATGDLVVNINSPGGSYFEGAAIYTVLQQYTGKVVVNILGVAASAASIIAMAGDEISISPAASIMIHNAQAGAMGDRHDFEDMAKGLAEIDSAIRAVYAARTGLSDSALDKMMTPLTGTWLAGKTAVDKGFADKLMEDNDVVADARAPGKIRSARAQFDAILAREGMSRKERRAFQRELFADKTDVAAAAPDEIDGRMLREIAESLRGLGAPRAA